MKQLFDKVKIGGLTSRNRFAVLPMERAHGTREGDLTETAIKRYHEYCLGGAGIVILEATSIQRTCRSGFRQFILDLAYQPSREKWELFIRELKRENPDTIIIFQFQHPGEVGIKTLDHPHLNRMTVKPIEGYEGVLLDEKYIDRYIELQANTAKFLYDIGVDGVDMKFCHGYLGSQILRPFNDRQWKYGGSFDNRSRFAFETCEQIRNAVPDRNFLVGSRISMFEEMAGGQGHPDAKSSDLNMSEQIALLQGLEARGCSWFGETLGGAFDWIGDDNMCPNPATGSNWKKHIAAGKLMKTVLKPETVVIGAGLSGSQTKEGPYEKLANRVINEDAFDIIGFGRQAFADPALPAKLQAGKSDSVNWCYGCNRCGHLLANAKDTKCLYYGRD